MSSYNSSVLEWKHALEIIVPVILTNFLISALKKAVNKQVYNFWFLLILVATFTSWLAVSNILGLSMILISASMMAELINTAFLDMIEKKERALAVGFLSCSLGVIISGLMPNKHYILGSILMIIGIAIFTWVSKKKQRSIRSQ